MTDIKSSVETITDVQYTEISEDDLYMKKCNSEYTYIDYMITTNIRKIFIGIINAQFCCESFGIFPRIYGFTRDIMEI